MDLGDSDVATRPAAGSGERLITPGAGQMFFRSSDGAKLEDLGKYAIYSVASSKNLSGWIFDSSTAAKRELTRWRVKHRDAQVVYAQRNQCNANAYRQSYVPSDLLPLHKRLLAARDQRHAHADLTVMDVKLYLHKARGKPFVTMSSNLVHGLEELDNIDQIIRLIEGTLVKMYADSEIRERALFEC